MNTEKLNSDEVPHKFREWLLSMGCPQEHVPSSDKISEMCRGQYYMVWRSLMETVGPKDSIKNKRLQVFADDVIQCQTKVFHKRNVVVPEELTLWKEQNELNQKLSEAESRLKHEKDNLSQLINKISSKLSHRDLCRKKLQDSQRRAWLLYQLAEELRDKRTSLEEMRGIADSLCCMDNGADIESKIDKCISALSRHSGAGAVTKAAINPAACSSIISTNSDNDAEEQILSLVRCRGDVLYKQLFERRAKLCSAIADAPTDGGVNKDRQTPQSILAQTSSLHCTLALEATKNKIHIQRLRDRLAAMITEMNSSLSGESCELLVVRSERARAEARLAALRALQHDMTAGQGVFSTADRLPVDSSAKRIHQVDSCIESNRDELRRLISSSMAVQRKTQNVKECLFGLFNNFHCENNGDNHGYTGPASIPAEPIPSIRRFYEERYEKNRNKMELSMELDSSDSGSFSDSLVATPKFVDELKIYLKKFNLNNNRKLVLESGEKIWIFESIASAIDRVRSSWQSDEIYTSLLCPSVSVTRNLTEIQQTIDLKGDLEQTLKSYESSGKRECLTIDITTRIEQEDKNIEKIKKKLNDNIINLQKTEKSLDIAAQNLAFWSDNRIKNYISKSRRVDGRSLDDFENVYKENIQLCRY